jgi:DNA helicase-2/ATP-dependent DNA helicase PcrA
VLRLRVEVVGFDRQAVLFRAASHANVVEVALAAAGIPFRKYGGIRFTEAAHVKDVLALLRLVANPRDVLSWVRVLCWCEGIGEKRAEALAEQIAAAPEPALDPEPWRKKKAFTDLLALRRVLLDADQARGDLVALVGGVVEAYAAWMDRLYDDAHRRRKDLDSLVVIAERHDDLDALLSDLALEPPEPGGEAGPADDEGQLTLSTVHSAKGLEWDTVHLIQLGNGAFPSGWSLDDPASLEEERRLLYVAVTRARRRLRLYQPRWLDGRAAVMAGPGCVLLEAIPDLSRRLTRARGGRFGAAAGPAEGDGQGSERAARLLAWFDG